MGLISSICIGTAVVSGLTSVGASYISDLQVNDKIEALEDKGTVPNSSSVPTTLSTIPELIPIPGPQGEKGETGERGLPGLQGEQGLPGIPGKNGIQGPTGSSGIQGPQGNTGPTGIRGEIGPTGPRGDTGLQGEQGLDGNRGRRGPRGIPGTPGIQGEIGLTGPPGPNCPLGYHLEIIELHQRAPVDQDLPVVVCVEDTP